jgi:hypothetical protein
MSEILTNLIDAGSCEATITVASRLSPLASRLSRDAAR